MNDRYKLVPLADLVPYARNSRTHSKDQLVHLQAMILEYGWTNNVLADTNGIVAGHGRCLAADAIYKSGGTIRFPDGEPLPTGMVPVTDCTGWPEAKRRAYIIADNQSALLAGWDKDVLAAEVSDISEAGFDLDLLGFTSDELDNLLDPMDDDDTGGSGSVEAEADEVETPTSVRGDIWSLGQHRLMCGSSTDREDVSALMQGLRASLVFTDPPYGVSYESESLGTIKNDQHRDDDLVQKLLLPALKMAVEFSEDDAAFYIWHASSTRRDFEWAMNAAGIQEKQYIIWVKPTFALGRSDYHWQHEPCYYGQKAGHRAKYIGDRKQATVWRVSCGAGGGTMALANGVRISDGNGHELFIQPRAPKNKNVRLIRVADGDTVSLTTASDSDTWEIALDPKSEYIHPTQKPTELAQRAIKNHIDRGELVLDLFAGSGSTLMAAQKTGRKCYTMDLDEKFVDRVIMRWQEFTGMAAVHADTGKTYDEMRAERNG